ncbi:MAG: TolC family protein [Gallionella sp.]|nr:TolC family protein [Gallionella sp.]
MKILLLVLLLIAGTARAEEPQLGRNLNVLLDYAREHNPEFSASRYEAEAAQLKVQPAGAYPDPVLRMELMNITNQGTNKSASLLPSQIGSTRYLLMQSVPWFGKQDLQQQVAQAQVAQSTSVVSSTWLALSSRIKSVYAQQYYLASRTQLTRQTLDLVNNLTQIAQTRYANGIGTQQAVIRAQLEAGNLRSELLELDNAQHHAHSQMNALLFRPIDALLVEPSQWRALPALPDINTLASHNPLIQSADAKVLAAEKSLELAYINRYPNLTLGIAPTQVGNTLRTWDLMFEFNLPLQQDSRRAQEQEATALLSAAKARKAALLNQLQANVAESLSGYETAQHTESLTRQQLIPQAELTYQSALAGYTTGTVDFASLLEAQRQILNVKQQQLKAQLDMQLRFAEIELNLGE